LLDILGFLNVSNHVWKFLCCLFTHCLLHLLFSLLPSRALSLSPSFFLCLPLSLYIYIYIYRYIYILIYIFSFFSYCSLHFSTMFPSFHLSALLSVSISWLIFQFIYLLLTLPYLLLNPSIKLLYFKDCNLIFISYISIWHFYYYAKLLL
jgi:hypothetical protein